MTRSNTLLLVTLFFLPWTLLGQGNAVLDVNQVHARFQSDGHIGISATLPPFFYVPANADNTGPSPLFAASIWFGGLDTGGSLHLAATYFEQVGYDYFPGPLGVNAGITPSTSAQYDQVWTVDRADVSQQIAYFNCLADPNCDTQAEFPNYSIPSYFYQWPAHGDVSLGQAYDLAPFYDFNGDGHYNPTDGDAPCVPGDQALFSIFNDNLSTHGESGGEPIGLEVHMTPFAYSGNSNAVDQTIFIRYHIINRGALTLHDTYMGLWNDFDLGCYADDQLQCDVGRNLFFALNGNDVDNDCDGEVGYGLQPPAFGEVILQGPLMDADGIDNTDTLTLPGYNGTGFNDGIIDNERSGMSYCLDFNNSMSSFQNEPTDPSGFYDYLSGRWLDGTPMAYGGSGYPIDSSAVVARYMYPGDSDPLGVGTSGQVMPPWTEATSGDRRGVASMGPFTLMPGQEQDIVVAYVYARAASGGPVASAEALRLRTDSIRAFAETIPGLLSPGSPCDDLPTGIAGFSARDQNLQLYPNPATDLLTLIVPSVGPHGQIQVIDAQGRLALSRPISGASTTLDVAGLASGLYLVRVQDGAKYLSARFAKQ